MSDPLRVLVVDDEQALATVIASYLEREGFAVDLAHDGPSAVAAARDHRPDLVVLDVMLPGFDGIEVCRQVRGFSDAYIIMLTARDEEVDKVVGLSVGADDYLVKPFSPRELIARVRAMLRRPRSVTGPADEADPAPESEPLAVGGLLVDTVAHRASLDGEPIDLTRTEFDLLAYLAEQPGRVSSREELLEQVWGYEIPSGGRTIDSHVASLRRKLGADIVRTVHGVGYAVGADR